jgi:histidyl-tRNA synthetase
LFKDSEIGTQGVQEVKKAMQWSQTHKSLANEVVFDITLARGLNYYTGCIFEVKALDAEMGSIGGGGRYDELTATFGLKGIPGVGISFGAERIYDVMEELGLFPEGLQNSVPAILLAMDEPCLEYAFRIASRLRQDGAKVDLYPEAAKMKKQFKYTDDRGFNYALVCGEEEMKDGCVSVKNMKTGDQVKMTYDEILTLLTTC